MVEVNEYFDGRVKSLKVDAEFSKQTVGVMKPGEYEFNTDSKEIMTVVFGSISVFYPEYDEWEDFDRGCSFDVPAKSTLKVKVDEDCAYLCEYVEDDEEEEVESEEVVEEEVADEE